MSTANGGATEPVFWAAADMAKAGYPVLPENQDKNTTVEGGFYAATTDASQVAEWILEGHEHHDVAFATGIVSGVVVLDADTPEAVAKMEADYGEPTASLRRAYGTDQTRRPLVLPPPPQRQGTEQEGGGGPGLQG